MMNPRIAILHYSALPIIGGVEQVIAQHTRLFLNAGLPVTLVTGRGGSDDALAGAQVVVIPELDSECPANLHVADGLSWGMLLREFRDLQTRIERALLPVCAEADLLIVHNAFNFHFNLPLTTVLHHLLDQGSIRRMVAWAHDISRYVNPMSGASLRFGFPWDLLRTYRRDTAYVAVSHQRQRVLAQVLRCSEELIRVIPNGTDPDTLLGLGAMTRHLVDEFQLLQADLILLMPIRITRAKNIKRALEIVAEIKKLGLRPKLIVTGPPDPHTADGQAYLHELMALRHELNLPPDVIFLSEGTSKFPGPLTVGASVVAELYRTCDAVLMTSDREGFGLPIIEGGLIGKPVFTTEAPALEELDANTVYKIGRDEASAHVAARIREWARQDGTHRLRCHIRQDLTWPAIFQRSIQPLLAERTVPVEVEV
ncbi:MAG: glycosyltransferase family 4 protein [Acidobacteriota bacterium]